MSELHVDELRKLSPREIEDEARIRSLLNEVQSRGVVLQRGVNRRLERETATVVEVGDDRLTLRPVGFERGVRSFILSFTLPDGSYSFRTRSLDKTARSGVLTVEFPRLLFCAERRERLRRAAVDPEGKAWQVRVLGAHGAEIGWVADSSPGGLGVRVSETFPFAKGNEVHLEILAGPRKGDSFRGLVRHRSGPFDGWIHLGLQAASGRGALIEPVYEGTQGGLAARLGHASAAARLVASRAVRTVRRPRSTTPDIQVVHFPGADGERIVGIIDSCGDPRGAPGVIIPPPWGRTKETLLPLARTIVSMFEKAGRSVSVLRFDGTRRKGESFNDPQFRFPGKEHHGFTFSHAVRDIEAGVAFLSQNIGARGIVLVTYSIASIEGRRALARNLNRSISGWVSLVGPPDLQSTVHSVSGGIDYLAGAERGVRFGLREILGVEVDIDRTASDALAEGIGFIDDSCRDFEQIDVPVSWLHGAHDGWMNLERVRKALSSGDSANRRLVIVPCGHQLRTSRVALRIFGQVAEEVGRIVGGGQFSAPAIDLVDLEARHRAERGRRPAPQLDARSFWHHYLLGRDGKAGMELMVQTPIYQELMALQADALRVRRGDTVADLGSGLGTLWSTLQKQPGFADSNVKVVEIDLTLDALRVARSIGQVASSKLFRVFADFEEQNARVGIALADRSCDSVLASLLVSYLSHPAHLLGEAFRILRPGGRIVVSTLKRDADFSQIWGENASVLKLSASSSSSEMQRLNESLDSFLNDAARVLSFEEAGHFEFFEPYELSDLLRSVGFEDVVTAPAFGDPPQAIVATGRRPENLRTSAGRRRFRDES